MLITTSGKSFKKIERMLDDDTWDGTCCCMCYQDFRDTEGARISHGYAVVCHECWEQLPLEKRKQVQKAFFYTSGYLFTIVVPYEKHWKELTIKPLHNIDQVVYEVYDEQFLCVVGLNEKANWDADRKISSHLIYEIGNAIEKKEKG